MPERFHEGRRSRIGGWVRRHLLLVLALYLVGVGLTQVVVRTFRGHPVITIPSYYSSAELPVVRRDGSIDPAQTARVYYTGGLDPAATHNHPIILLHGSPGSGSGFFAMGEQFRGAGYAWIAPDLPGFGWSDRDLPDIGSRAHARYVLELMDTLGIERAHVVGWSNGGAVALNMVDLEPDRVATLTLLAAVGVQETEGSGSHFFEHTKYDLGRALFWSVRNLTPHFGLFGTGDDEWVRNFQQTDQRLLRAIMENVRTPTLILHGRHDFLTPAWGAEAHHELIPTSQLVMLDSDHFMPFMAPELATSVITPFIERHDTPDPETHVEPITTYDNRAPVPTRSGPARLVQHIGEHVRWWPWWVCVLSIAFCARKAPESTAAFVGLLVGRVDLDIGVALVGLVLGRSLRVRTPKEHRGPVLGAIAVLLWSGVSLVLASALGGLVERAAPAWGGWAMLPMYFGVVALLWIVRLGTFREGRQRIRAFVRRCSHHEWWPAWTVYLPILPIVCRHAFRPGGVLAPTAANPGMPHGGIVGESKADILRALGDDPRVLQHAVIRAGGTPDERTDRALAALRDNPALGGLPTVCKPDAGERGTDVTLVRTEERLRRFFRDVRAGAILQRYHPGPGEVSVFWQRTPAGVDDPSLAGEVVAVTHKGFPDLVGNGRWTLRRLLFEHPRGRCRIDAHLRDFAGHLGEVPADGERVPLTTAGNHARGCLFTDGRHLLTPELVGAVDRVARGFCADDGGVLDTGRFDLRYTDEAALKRGEFGVVEVNGVTSEPTNMYDPNRCYAYCAHELRSVWRRVYALGEARVRAGAKPTGFRELARLVVRARLG